MTGIAHRKAAKKRVSSVLPTMLLALLLFSGCIAVQAGWEKGGGGRSGPPDAAQTAERDLSTFNKAVASAVLIGGSLFVIYYVRRHTKTGSRRKARVRTARREQL